jgi:hypothetical protein
MMHPQIMRDGNFFLIIGFGEIFEDVFKCLVVKVNFTFLDIEFIIFLKELLSNLLCRRNIFML